MTDDEEYGEEGDFYRAFRSELLRIDEIANVVLKAHLIVEWALDTALQSLLFYPNDVLAFRYESKAKIARALAAGDKDHPHWKIIFALNKLRNDIAHNHEGENRARLLNALRQVTLEGCAETSREDWKEKYDIEIVIFAGGLCLGFLEHIKDNFAVARDELELMLARAGVEVGVVSED